MFLFGTTTIASSNVSFNDSLKLLGVTLDATLSFDKHVSNVVRSCTFHTRAQRHIRPLLTVEAAKTAAAAIVGIRLDYCNSLPYGSTDRNLNRLQRAQTTLAHVVLQAPRSASTTAGCGKSCTGFPSGNGSSVKWSQSLSKRKTSVNRHTYMTCYTNTSPPGHNVPPQLIFYINHASTSVSSRAFSVAAPTVWNQLTVNTRTASTLGTFKTRLKTELCTLT